MSGQEFRLDKAAFSEELNLFALKVPAKLCNGTRKAMKEHALTMPRVHSVLKPTPAETEAAAVPAIMVILLRYLARKPGRSHRGPPRGNADEAMVGLEPAEVAARLRATPVPAKTPADVSGFMAGIGASDVTRRTVRIEYSQWTVDAVLRALLPEDVTVPTSFETVGHIAHLNLRDEHMPYKGVIGRVMVDKLQPRIRTVVNKLQSTGGPYRTFAMEVLAGDSNLETSLKENGCTFKLDFAKVYWNSRLETEHRRIVRSLKAGDVLADAFCGIGPFTIPAAKEKRCKGVYANDLNPSSVEYLRKNAAANGLGEEEVRTSCSCARGFLRRLVREEGVPISRVVMNFPSGAPEFLDVFRGLYDAGRRGRVPLPVVHCYCFVKGAEDMGSARRRVRAGLFGEEEEGRALEERMPDEMIEVREVRDVAPRKRQVCVTFTVPESVAYGVRAEGDEDGREDGNRDEAKRRRIE